MLQYYEKRYTNAVLLPLFYIIFTPHLPGKACPGKPHPLGMPVRSQCQVPDMTHPSRWNGMESCYLMLFHKSPSARTWQRKGHGKEPAPCWHPYGTRPARMCRDISAMLIFIPLPCRISSTEHYLCRRLHADRETICPITSMN